MIYKETESVNDKPQEVPDDKIQENVLRGEKLIVRSKKSIQTIILADLFIFVMGITTLSLGSHFLDNLFLIIYPILSLFIFFMLFSTASIYSKWLYHILRNLRKWTETRFFSKGCRYRVAISLHRPVHDVFHFQGHPHTTKKDS